MVKRLMVAVLALVLLAIASRPLSPARAAEWSEGAALFAANCAACHVGGRNIIVSAKSLYQTDLERYGMASRAAIAQQIRQGNNAMPAFRGRLTAAEIGLLADYVLSQAARDWPANAP